MGDFSYTYFVSFRFIRCTYDDEKGSQTSIDNAPANVLRVNKDDDQWFSAHH